MTSMILSIDQGTTGTTAAFFDSDSLTLLANAKVEFPQIFPSPGLVEHDPEDIWSSVLAAIEKATQDLLFYHRGRALSQISAIGITNQRETVVAWHRRTGEVAGNALVWQDRRTAAECDALKENAKVRELIRAKTGLVCDPYFSATKMRWLMQNNPRVAEWARSGELVLGTVDAWLLFNLTGRQVVATEHTNASRTMLYDLGSGRYDSELLDLFGIPERALPRIHPSIFSFGVTKGVKGIPDGVPITGILGDQQAALMGQNCHDAGEAKITYGTGAFLLMHTGEKPMCSDAGLLTTVACAHGDKRTFALEGAAFIAGAAVQFLRDNFQWVKNSSESQQLAMSAPRDENVIFVPALAGLAAPFWNPMAKGVLFGLTRGTKKAQIVRSVLEAIALQNVQLLRLMEKASGMPLRRVGVDGGASKNDFMMQFQSDVLRIRLSRPENIETTAKGAAKAARLGIDPAASWESGEATLDFEPRMNEGEAKRIVGKWMAAVEWVNRFYAEVE